MSGGSITWSSKKQSTVTTSFVKAKYITLANPTKKAICVKIKEGRLDLFYFSFHFYFLFDLFFYFSIFRTTRVRVDWSCCHICHLMAKSQDRSQDLGKVVEDLRTNDIIQHGHHMLTSWTTHGCLG